MKPFILAVLLALSSQAALAATNNYESMERERAARQAKQNLVAEQRKKDSIRIQRENQERLSDLGKSQAQLRSEGKIKNDKPGRMMEIK